MTKRNRADEEGAIVFTHEILIGTARRSAIEHIRLYRKAKNRFDKAIPGIMPNAHRVAQEAGREMKRCRDQIITDLRARAHCMMTYEKLIACVKKPWTVRFPVMGGFRPKENGDLTAMD